MNFLAHIYLSGDDDEGLMIGNYIGDSVKGRRLSDYPFSIQCGILLHREIDSFTDSHPVYRQSKDRFVPVAGRYAGVVCDVVYDHFLAKNWGGYHSLPLKKYAWRAYGRILKNWFRLPGEMQRFSVNFISRQRLTAYATIDGIRDTLDLMSNVTSLPNCSDDVVRVMIRDYYDLENEFLQFFFEIRRHIDDFKMNF